ncbi:transcriptional regulator [Halorubrum xinjiangense]|uniref:transcriptional regulator n=1 Tax=Halorubrum xinjiangense TaxID=261291 RepID=UPI003C6F60C3
MTPMDDRVLEVLDAGLVLSPTIIAYNIDKSREAVGRRLSKLSEAGLVDRIERGRYEITDSGQSYLTGEVAVDDLQNRSS